MFHNIKFKMLLKILKVYRTPIPVEDMILEDLCPLSQKQVTHFAE